MAAKKKTLVYTLTQDIERSFQRFRLGLALCFVGFVGLYTAEQWFEPSLNQELAAALALMFIAVGLSLALGSELLFIFYRLRLFFSDKK